MMSNYGLCRTAYRTSLSQDLHSNVRMAWTLYAGADHNSLDRCEPETLGVTLTADITQRGLLSLTGLTANLLAGTSYDVTGSGH